jgi:hypothetical protein
MSDRNFAEQHLVVNGSTKTRDIFDTAKQSDIYNMKDWEDVIFIITKSTGVGASRYHLRSVSAVSAGSSHGMPFKYRYATGTAASSVMTAWADATSSGFISTVGASQIYELWGKADDLYAGDHYVMFDSTEITNSAVDATITALFFNGRFHEDINVDILT